ncbi:MAG: hypothetical protein QHH74_05630 [Spirochaetota bacterium]|nr:hypothetical protein [Spirochaetota bacterium]
MKISKKLFFFITIIAIFFFPLCERLDMYDIASQRSRTAYAISYDGTTHTLILANIHYEKKFTSATTLPSYSLGNFGMAVNDKNEIIVYNTLNSAAFSENNLIQWKITNIYPQSTFVFGFDNIFVNFFPSTLYYYNNQTDYWDYLLSLSPLTEGIFKGNDGQLYAYEYNGTTYTVTIHSINKLNTNLVINTSLNTGLLGTFVKGYKTKKAFYTFNKETKKSICKISSSMIKIVNETVDTGSSLIDAAVTDDDGIYCLVQDSSNYILKQIISDGNYPVLSSFGSDGIFQIDSLDDRHIVIASSGNTSGYNGLFIYDVDDNKIVKHITSTDVIALYVLR